MTADVTMGGAELIESALAILPVHRCAATAAEPTLARAAARLNGIMQRYAAGEATAFGELYAALAPRLHRFCLRLARNRSDADDLFQDAFLRLHRARASYMPGAPALHWAFAITRSAHLDRVRHRQRRREDLHEADSGPITCRSLPSGDGSPEDDVCTRRMLLVVDREIGRMSEKKRCAYVLLREEGLSVAEAASVLGTSADVVKQRAHRAYEQIRAALRRAGWDEGMP
ncbi:RNA polymerase sigma factor [Sorangium sp. So ce388]|uniref:RNA polymerase sigma factor n=1 Tax=Sorangium sp. So ce388 TaxID=3133309 RepID=UPI003F5BD9C3